MKKLLLLITLCLPGSVFAQEHARILDHFTRYTIIDSKNVEIEESYRIRINSEKGYQFGIYRDYFDRFRKIKDVSITILDKNGNKVKKLKRSDGREIGFSPSYEINDSKILVIDPQFQQYPFTMEVTSKVKLEGYLSLPTWVPRSYFNLAVDRSTLEVVRPTDLKVNLREQHVNGQTETSGALSKTSFTVSNLQSIEKKLRYEDFYEEQPKVFVTPEQFTLENTPGSNASWTAFGDWFVSLNSEPYTLTPKTMEFIDGLNKNDRETLIRAIYEYMQDKTRYVSIQLGIGGFKSLPTEEVEKYGYGDCKALTTYMKNMLDYAGVKSNYVLVRAGDDVPDVIADLPGNQFNHVYLGIPDKKDTVYLECTTQTGPSNYTGTFTDDRNVLWIEKNSSAIIRSRVYSHENNLQLNKTSLKVDEKGNAVVEINSTNKGIFFDEAMIFSSAPDDYIENYNQRKFNYKDFTVKGFKFDQPARSTAEFTSNYVLEVNGLGKTVGDKLILPVSLTAPVSSFIDHNAMMRYFSIKRGLTVTDEIEVALPQNYWIYNLPEAEMIETPYGKYELSIETEANKLIVKRKVILYKGNYTKEGFDEFKTFYDQIEKLESRKLVLDSKT